MKSAGKSHLLAQSWEAGCLYSAAGLHHDWKRLLKESGPQTRGVLADLERDAE